MKTYTDLLQLQSDLNEFLNAGFDVFVNRVNKHTLEQIGVCFRVDFVPKSAKSHYGYFSQFYQLMKDDIKNKIAVLMADDTNRQVVIDFTKNYPGENFPCFIVCHVLLRKGFLFLSVFQRSMNIDMLEQDISFFNHLGEKILRQLEKDGIVVQKCLIDFHISSLHREKGEEKHEQTPNLYDGT